MNLDDSGELKRRLGFGVNLNSDEDRRRLAELINAKLWFRGQPIVGDESEFALLKTSKHLLANLQEKNRLLAEYHCPTDARIQAFLDRYLAGCGCDIPRMPTDALQLEHHGLARTLSLPPDKDSYTSEYLNSYRIEQGVLHNPRSDRRTTKGVFHIVEGGLAISHDKIEVPKAVFAALLGQAQAKQRPFTIHHSINGSFAIRRGKWKLSLCPGSGGWSNPKPAAAKKNTKLANVQLYNLEKDPAESTNLQAQRPKLVQKLVNTLAKAIKNGRTTPGQIQANEGHPNTFSQKLLTAFPALGQSSTLPR